MWNRRLHSRNTVHSTYFGEVLCSQSSNREFIFVLWNVKLLLRLLQSVCRLIPKLLFTSGSSIKTFVDKPFISWYHCEATETTHLLLQLHNLIPRSGRDWFPTSMTLQLLEHMSNMPDQAICAFCFSHQSCTIHLKYDHL